MILNPEDMQIEEIATRNRAISQLLVFLLPCSTEINLPLFPFDQAAQKPLYSSTNWSSMIIEAPLNPANSSKKKFDCANEAILTGTLIAKIIADLRILMYWLEKQSFFGHLF